MTVAIRRCKLFEDTFLNYAHLAKKVFAFIDHKSANPMAPYGGSDTGFTPDGPIGLLKQNIKHAHLTQDVSLVYRVHGANPRILDLIGIFSHKESGTGNASNIRIQQQLATKIGNQEFPPLPGTEQPAANQQNQKKNKKR